MGAMIADWYLPSSDPYLSDRAHGQSASRELEVAEPIRYRRRY